MVHISSNLAQYLGYTIQFDTNHSCLICTLNYTTYLGRYVQGDLDDEAAESAVCT